MQGDEEGGPAGIGKDLDGAAGAFASCAAGGGLGEVGFLGVADLCGFLESCVSYLCIAVCSKCGDGYQRVCLPRYVPLSRVSPVRRKPSRARRRPAKDGACE